MKIYCRFDQVRRNPEMHPNAFTEFAQLVTHEGSTLFSAPELMKEALVFGNKFCEFRRIL
jgi:hypothetical protein